MRDMQYKKCNPEESRCITFRYIQKLKRNCEMYSFYSTLSRLEIIESKMQNGQVVELSSLENLEMDLVNDILGRSGECRFYELGDTIPDDNTDECYMTRSLNYIKEKTFGEVQRLNTKGKGKVVDIRHGDNVTRLMVNSERNLPEIKNLINQQILQNTPLSDIVMHTLSGIESLRDSVVSAYREYICEILENIGYDRREATNIFETFISQYRCFEYEGKTNTKKIFKSDFEEMRNAKAHNGYKIKENSVEFTIEKERKFKESFEYSFEQILSVYNCIQIKLQAFLVLTQIMAIKAGIKGKLKMDLSGNGLL